MCYGKIWLQLNIKAKILSPGGEGVIKIVKSEQTTLVISHHLK